MDESWLTALALSAPMMVLALTVHECAHAWTARLFGDSTAEDAGRVSLNPLVHLDLMGTLAMVFCGFGWARPVPYDRGNLLAAHPRWARWTELGVAAAGPVSNLLLAGLLRGILAVVPAAAPASPWSVLALMMVAGVYLNVGLFLFNLIPIHPLDGFTVLRNALPLNAALRFQQTRAYGAYLLMGFLVLSRLGWFPLAPARDFLLEHVYFLRA